MTVYYTLTNLEGGTVPQGQIVITDSSGEILGTDSSPKITSGSIDYSTVVNWPWVKMSKYQLPGTWVENQSATTFS